jgi:hypothetical protein
MSRFVATSPQPTGGSRLIIVAARSVPVCSSNQAKNLLRSYSVTNIGRSSRRTVTYRVV